MKKKNQKKQETPLIPKINVFLNQHPVDYVHTSKFAEDGTDVMKKARAAVARFAPSALDDSLGCFMNPLIDADTYDEIEFGSEQYTRHTAVIFDLYLGAKEATLEARKRKDGCERELEAKREELEQLRALRARYVEGG